MHCQRKIWIFCDNDTMTSLFTIHCPTWLNGEYFEPVAMIHEFIYIETCSHKICSFHIEIGKCCTISIIGIIMMCRGMGVETGQGINNYCLHRLSSNAFSMKILKIHSCNLLMWKYKRWTEILGKWGRGG